MCTIQGSIASTFLDPLTPTTSRTWGPLPAPADENAVCGTPSPPKGRGSEIQSPSAPAGAAECARRGVTLQDSFAPAGARTFVGLPPTAYAVGYYLPPLRGCEQQRLLLPPRLTPWAIIFRRSAAASNSGFSSPHGLRRGLLSSAAPRLRATAASPPPTAHAVGYYLPPLRGCEQQRLLLPPRLTPWAIIFRRSAAGSNSGFSSPHGLRRGLLSSAAPRLESTQASFLRHARAAHGIGPKSAFLKSRFLPVGFLEKTSDMVPLILAKFWGFRRVLPVNVRED